MKSNLAYEYTLHLMAKPIILQIEIDIKYFTLVTLRPASCVNVIFLIILRYILIFGYNETAHDTYTAVTYYTDNR